MKQTFRSPRGASSRSRARSHPAEPLEPRRLLSSISGVSFTDSNGNGVRDANEPRSGATVYLDLDNDFAEDRGVEPYAWPDAQGRWSFTNLPAGRYHVRQDLSYSVQQTTPPPGEPIVVDLGPVEHREGLLFGSRQSPTLRTIRGTVFHDADVDGVRDPAEVPSGLHAAYIDRNNDGQESTGEPRVLVGQDGRFSLGGLAPGRYRLRIGYAFAPVRASTYGPDGLVVDVRADADPAVDIGVYRPNAVVADAWFQGRQLPLRLTVLVLDALDGRTVAAAGRITNEAGEQVRPDRTRSGQYSGTIEYEFDQPLPAGRYTLTIPGAALKGSPGTSTPPDYTFTFDYPPPPARIVARHVFYNRSAFDGRSAAANAADDAAIATDKHPLMPGEAASFANVTTFTRGINGIMLDVEHFTPGQLGVDFRVGNGGDPEQWPQLQVERAVTLRRRAGVGGSDRYTYTWPDGAIRNTWLRVRVTASQATGLEVHDVFYFGNLPGETGNTPGAFAVSPSDVARVRARLGETRAPIDSPFDFDRDGRVNARDLLTARSAVGRALQPPPRELTGAPSAPVLLAASDSGVSATDDVTNFNNAGPSRALRFLIGSTTPGATVTIYADGVAIGSAVATGPVTAVTTGGAAPLADGVRSFTARQVLADGTVARESAALPVTIDTAAPATPPAPDLLWQSDTGASEADDLTSDTTPSFTVRGAPYSRVYRNGSLVSAEYYAAPTFHYLVPPLPDGPYAFAASAVDAAGNESARSAPIRVMIDSTAPASTLSAPAVSAAGGDAYALSVEYADASGVDPATLDGTDVLVTGPNGFTQLAAFAAAAPAAAPGRLAARYVITPAGGHWDAADAGEYTVRLQSGAARDLAGVPTPAAVLGTFTVDVADANLPGVHLLPELDTGLFDWDDVTRRNNGSPGSALRFRVVNTTSGATVSILAGDVVLGTAVAGDGTATTVVTDGATRLADGVHAITARVTPAGGGAPGPASAPLSLTVDTTAPVASAPALHPTSDTGTPGDGVTATTRPTFTVTASEAGVIHVASTRPEGGAASQFVPGPGAHAVAFAPAAGYLAPTRHPADPGVIRQYAVDVNGDGRLDVVTSNQVGGPTQYVFSISVMLGNGDGTFQPPRATVLNRSTEPAFADFNRDGKTDLVGAEHPSADPFIVFRPGNGDGTFGEPRQVPSLGSSTALRAADLNADGNPDVLVANGGDHGLTVLLGNGDGTFQPPVAYGPRVQSGGPMHVFDLNGDGLQDVLVAGQVYGSVRLYFGEGGGRFRQAQPFDTGLTQIDHLEAADFDSDGREDFVIVSTGGFQTQQYVYLSLNPDGSPRLLGMREVPGGLGRFVVGDFDRDGSADLATTQYADDVSYLTFVRGNGDGNGTFDPPQRSPMGARGAAVVAGDFNADGRIDFVTPDRDGAGFFLLTGAGGPLPPGPHSFFARMEDLAGNRSADSATTLVTVQAGAAPA